MACKTKVTDILSGRRCRLNKPEDLPDSVIRSFREQELGNDVGICCMPVLLFVSCCCFYCAINTIGMKKQYQAVTAEEAVKVIKSGDHVHISSVSNVPQCLVKALCERGRAGELKNVYIHHLHTEGAAPYVNPEFPCQRRQGHHCHAIHHTEGHQQNRACTGFGIGCRYHAQPYPLVHHRIWRSQFIWQIPSRTGEADNLGSASAVSGRVRGGRLQAFWLSLSLYL